MPDLVNERERKKANTRLSAKLGLLVVGMFGFGFAMVPLYDVFCNITGLNGKTGRMAVQDVGAQPIDEDRILTVEFVANLNQSMNWEFRPTEGKLRVHPGKLYTTSYYARNKAAQRMVGQAIPSVAPGQAALYFKKTECFCFQRQPFEASEGRNMPVSFIVESDLPEDIETITLSYTFFDVTETAALQ
jgi:cytochrome c oxidase assembly protein subunit 11